MSKLPKLVSEFADALHDFYKPLADPASRFTDVSDWGPSLTRQEFAEDADINVLMARFPNSGILPPLVAPEYVDFTQVPGDLMSQLEVFDRAAAAFMTLPAQVRKEFENNPHAFVSFAVDPVNLEQMRTWGLAPPAEVPDAPREPPLAPAAPAPGAAPAAAGAAPKA